MEIHGKFVDSLTVRAFTKEPHKYEKFVKNFIPTMFGNSRSCEVDFIGEKFKGVLNFSEKDGRPIKLRKDGNVILGFTKGIPKIKAPIGFQIIQPLIWKSPFQTLRRLKKDLEFHVGELQLEVERIDLALHFSGWEINENIYNCIQTQTSNISSYRKDKIYSSIAVGTLHGEIPFMRLYNKTKFLRENPFKPSPSSIYTRKPHFGKDVWNLEMSFNSNVLKKGFGVRTPEEVFDAIPSLWSYATKDFVYISSDDDRSKVHPIWAELSSAYSDLGVDYFKRKSRSKKDPNFEYRNDQLVKSARSFAELLNVSWQDLLSWKYADILIKYESKKKE
jgi:hypothetical protein